MSEPEILPPAPNLPALPERPAMVRASTDEQLIEIWLSGRPASTQDAYRRDSAAMLDFVGVGIRQIMLEDLQAYKASLADLKISSQCRKLNAVKSPLTFAQKTGYTILNVGAALFLPKQENLLAERILDEADVITMIRMEKNQRNQTILRLLYLAGMRVSELCGLEVRHLRKRGDTGQVSVFGKGSKTRTVLLKPSMWEDLLPFIEGKRPEDPVFMAGKTGKGRKGRPLGRRMVDLVIKRAAARVGLSEKVSCHFLRHSAASHSLDNGAPISLVRDMLGHRSLETTSKYLHLRPTESASKFLKG